MAIRVLLAVALCVFGLAVARAADHACCSSPTKGWATSGKCTVARCNSVMQLTSHPELIEFLDACRMHIDTDYVFSVMACAAPRLRRSNYMNLLFAEQAPESQYTQRSMEGRIAALVLGYGCMQTSTTPACKELHIKEFSRTDGLFGLVNASFSIGATGMLYGNLTSLVRNCLASTSGDFASSEFATGASRCAAVGTDAKPADFAGVVEGALSQAAANTCPTCSTTGSELPFCASHYNGGRGLRCSSRAADRVAQSFYNQWTKTNVATIGGVSVNVTSTACEAVMYNVSCETSLATCNRPVTSMTRCQHICHSNLMHVCDLSGTDAATVCKALGANDTVSPCPSAAPTTATATNTSAPSAAAIKDLYELLADTSSNTLTAFTVTLCIQSDNETAVTAFVSQHYQGLCAKASGGVCEIRNASLEPGNATCPWISTVDLTTTRATSAASNAAQTKTFTSAVQSSFGAASASVSSSRVAQEFVALKITTSGSASVASVSLMSLLCVALAALLNA